jgi:hypothetical protein
MTQTTPVTVGVPDSPSRAAKGTLFSATAPEYRASPQDSVRHMEMANTILSRLVRAITIPPFFPK